MPQKDETKLLLSKAQDTIDICENKYMVKSVGFLTPSERVFLQKSLKKPYSAKTMFFGGYDEAERTLFIAFPEYVSEEEAKEELCALCVTARNLGEMSHRDFLGSLMGLGIKREMVGDIVLSEDRCIIFVRSEIKDYILTNLEKIGRDGILVSLCENYENLIPKKKTEEIRGTVSSVRLDSVLATALKTSRSKAVSLILGKVVSVNWEETENVSKTLSEGDIISVKGKGRFKLSHLNGQTKKGRDSIVIEKYV